MEKKMTKGKLIKKLERSFKRELTVKEVKEISDTIMVMKTPITSPKPTATANNLKGEYVVLIKK